MKQGGKKRTYSAKRAQVTDTDAGESVYSNVEDEFTAEDADITLYEDIEDYIEGCINSQNSNAIAVLPPVLKYNKQWYLSVTDLSSQLWCEKQVEFTLITGKKVTTEAMQMGTERHEELELEDHEVIEVIVETNEDKLGIKFLNSINLIEQLLDTGKCREVWVFGQFGDYIISGIIDQLEIRRNNKTKCKSVLISDTKTRTSKTSPSVSQLQGAALQVQMYCMILQRLQKGDVVFDRLYQLCECDRNAPFVSEELVPEGTLAALEKRFAKTCQRLPPIAEVTHLSYEHKGEIFKTQRIQLNEPSLLYTVKYLVDYWDGERDAESVKQNEAWKCKMCEFKESCLVSPLAKQHQNMGRPHI